MLGQQLSLPLSTPYTSNEAGPYWPLDTELPVEDFEPLIQLEAFNKHRYRPNTYLHKWWARRSGVLFRLILKGLVRDPAKRDYYAPGGLEGLRILDPMMGGGTTLHEAIRMGANVVGIDIDPIPVLQARASLQRPSLVEKRRIFQSFWRDLRQVLQPYFTTQCPVCGREAEIQFVLYARQKQCRCGETGVLESFTLLESRQGERSIVICPKCGQVHQEGEHLCPSEGRPKFILKQVKNCPVCGEPYRELTDQPFWRRYHPIAVRGRCSAGHEFFKNLEDADWRRMAEAEAQASRLNFGDETAWLIPQGPKSKDLHRYGVRSYLDLFTPRQRLYLATAQQLLQKLPPSHRQWLGLLVSTSLEFHSLLAGYKGRGKNRPGAVRHVFAHHAYSLPYTALENNPVFSQARSGTLLRLFQDRIVRATRWAQQPVERYLTPTGVRTVPILGEIDGGIEVHDWASLQQGTRRFRVLQADAAQVTLPAGLVDVVVTDPPYYDSVQYADLSHFFRVWLRYLLPDDARWEYDPLASAVSENDAEAAQKYADVLGRIWQNAVRALKAPHGRVIFTFHHAKARAWAALTLSLRRASLRLVAYYVAFSENPTSVHIQGLRALKHDAILVLAPRGFQAPERSWMQPERIDTTDSRGFVAGCAQLLGYLLAIEDLEEASIWGIWKRFLEGA